LYKAFEQDNVSGLNLIYIQLQNDQIVSKRENIQIICKFIHTLMLLIK